MVVVVSGNPFDGLAIHGPFHVGNCENEWATANEWASDALQGKEWWVVEVQEPSTSKI